VTVDLDFFKRLVEFAHRNDVALVHDFAYADIAFDGYRPPSLLQVDGAKEVAVELYTLSKSHSMAGWRVGFVVGNAEIVSALQQLKSYLDYGTFQPIQIASIIALNEHDAYIGEVVGEYRVRRDTLIDGLAQAGWHVAAPDATMFVWARIPESHAHMGSLAFALDLLDRAAVAVSPGIGFGPSGDDHVRFALVENPQRIAQAMRNIRRYLADPPPSGNM
jgi:alanine-synthesizing transaminase